MLTNKRDVWLGIEKNANGHFNYAVDRLNGSREEHFQWLRGNGVEPCDYYVQNFIAMFVHDGDAMRFYLAWGQ
jgi:hypothetical protein